MQLKCYVYDGWAPRIRAAGPARGWMDDAPEAFPYRCLPLAMANGHGWEILAAGGFEVEWNGGPAASDLVVRADAGTGSADAPVSLFGLGIFTVHVQALFRTPPGWNLWLAGPPNSGKDGAAPLTGLIETDWSPYTFTINWQMTRPGHTVRFEENEVIASFFPVERGVVERFEPAFARIEDDAALKHAFETWSASRDAFQEAVRVNPPVKPADKWQKLYYRGLSPDGTCPEADHQTRLRLAEFANPGLCGPAAEAMKRPVVSAPRPQEAPAATRDASAKSDWILETQARNLALSPAASGILRAEAIGAGDFLDNFYAPGRAVVIGDAARDWPACRLWSPAYLRHRLGDAVVEYQAGRSADANFERDKAAHVRKLPFDRFIDEITQNPGNNAYVTAYNSASNAAALAPLRDDLGALDQILDADGTSQAMFWIGPEGTFTPLHHDLTNNLLIQLVGRKRVVLAPASETPKLYNDHHVFSEIRDIRAGDLDFTRYPRLRDVRLHEIILEPGDALFIPIGWWHQLTALDFSVSATCTNFRWPNAGWESHPG